MKDKIARAKTFIRNHPIGTTFVVGGILGAAATRYQLKDRLVPDLDSPYLFCSDNLYDYMANTGKEIEFTFANGILLLTAQDPTK